MIIIALRPGFYIHSVPSLTFWVPFLTHTYILAAGLVSGVILDPPFLLWMGLLMFVLAFWLHWTTIKGMIR